MNNVPWVIIANIIIFAAGICSIISTMGKDKKGIVFIEFLGTILRVIGNLFVKGWTDAISKVIKGISQFLTIKEKYNKISFAIISCIFVILSIIILINTKDFKYLIAIIPSLLEFYALLSPDTKKYRWYIIITKLLWTINNLIFHLYVGIFFDIIVAICHSYKLKNDKIKKEEKKN